jgi:hypothetical protein
MEGRIKQCVEISADDYPCKCENCESLSFTQLGENSARSGPAHSPPETKYSSADERPPVQ